MSEYHELKIGLHGERADLWHCNECGRTVVIQYQPYKRIVLDEGDLLAAHTANKGGVNISDVHVTERENLP